MELITLGAFVVMLMGCIVAGIPTIFALLAGLVLFCVYALVKGNTLGAVALMCWHGIKPICGILGMLLFIGMLTGVWRAAGVIPAIVYYAVPFITPSLFVVMTFLLNALVSVLTGTSFGTAATMGAICISLAGTMNVPLPVAGGAALSGAFFGDRWSPISTSALLVADITGTDFYANLKRMLRSAAVPFVLTCAVFLALGMLMPAGSGSAGIVAVMGEVFDLNPIVLVPPVAVFALALMRIDILSVIAVGIVAAVPCCILLQGMNAVEVVSTLIGGYAAPLPELAALSGGGVVSMVSSVEIVCITSAYAGVFAETDLLKGIEGVVRALAARLSSFATTLVISVVASMISFNQTLAIMMTHQLSSKLNQSAADHALDIEDSVVLVAGLVPWSIAGGVPLASMGAPLSSMALAVFLYAVPLWRLVRARRSRVAVQPVDPESSQRRERLEWFRKLTELIEFEQTDEPVWDESVSDKALLNEARRAKLVDAANGLPADHASSTSSSKKPTR